MPEKKIIAVLGATGAQGGALVRAILQDESKEFAVRAITRNKKSESAKILTDLGAEVVTADIDSKASLVKAFNGAYGAFAVTFFWAHMDGTRETLEAYNIAKAASAARLKHVVYSTLEDTRKFIPVKESRMPVLFGKYNVPHFDGKGEANHFFTDLGVPVTFLHTSFFWENFIGLGMGPQRSPDGHLVFNLPLGDKALPGIAVEDIGKCALGIFKRGEELIGTSVGIAGDHNTGEQFAQAYSAVLGSPVNYRPFSFDEYRALDFPGAVDIGNMYEFQYEFSEAFNSLRSLEFSRTLNPGMLSFQQWLESMKEHIPIA